MDANLLNISPHHAFKGYLWIDEDEEVSLEQLKATLPNLNKVGITSTTSPEYVARFCTTFPLLKMLNLDSVECSDASITAISSLQNLRELMLSHPFTADQVYLIIKSLTNLEALNLVNMNVPLHPQSFLCLARMPRLGKLHLNVESVYKNIQVFANVNNFPELNFLGIYLNSAEFIHNNNIGSWSAEAWTKIRNHRPGLFVKRFIH